MTDLDRLRVMNAEIERLYKDGRDWDAHALEARADMLARRISREMEAS